MHREHRVCRIRKLAFNNQINLLMRIHSASKRGENHLEPWFKVTSGKINNTISEAGVDRIHVYTAEETCKLLSIAPRTLEHAMNAGKIAYYLIEEIPLFSESDIDLFLLSKEHVDKICDEDWNI